MSTKVHGKRVPSIPEMAAEAFFVALILAPVFEVMAVYEAGRQAGQQQADKPLWGPF